MAQTKPWYKSKTVLGGLVALIAGIASIFGISVGAEDQVVLTDALVGIGAALGGVVAVYGRVTAKGKISP